MQMALSRGANGFRREAGGVDEPARATDVFYGLANFSPSPRGPLLILARERHWNAIRRVLAGPTIAIRDRKNSALADVSTLRRRISRILRLLRFDLYRQGFVDAELLVMQIDGGCSTNVR